MQAPLFLCPAKAATSTYVDDVHGAAFLRSPEVLDVLLKTIGDLKDALLPRVEKLGKAILVHLEILWRDIGAELASDAFRFFVSDFYHFLNCSKCNNSVA